MVITGISNIDFTDKNGKRVKGVRVHGTQPFEDGQGEGQEAVSEFISEQRLKRDGINLSIGMSIKLNYTKKGRLTDIQVLDTLGDFLEVE